MIDYFGYIKTCVVQRKLKFDVEAGDKEGKYSCCPPPVCMIVMSIIQVMSLKLLMGLVIRH